MANARRRRQRRGECATGAAKARAAKKGAAAIRGAKLSQLRKSEALASAKVVAARAVGAGKGEVRGLEEKLARIQGMIAAEERG